MAEPASVVRFAHRSEDCRRTGPGTPAGRYLRQFWQPVYHSVDLATGRAVTIRIDHSVSMQILVDPGHSLDERILSEQFGH